jgi:plasmid stabilization system protein ParE
MKPIVFHPDATEEARAVAAHYAAIRAELAAGFHTELDAALARIGDNPLLYAAESGKIRVCPLRRFPYSIFYEDMEDRVWVAAVGHHHRRPAYWARRRPS